MKRLIFIGGGAIVALAIVVVLISGSLPFLAEEETAAHASAETQRNVNTSAPVAVAPAAAETRAVVAEAVVVPVEYATLSMSASGIAAEILVEEGDPVEAGQLILRLQNTHQRAAVARAEAAVASAQAQLAALEAGPRRQEIAVARASLDAAQARLARLQEGARAEEIAAARAGLDAAQASLDRLYEGPDEGVRIAAESDLDNAEAALRQAQAAYDQVAGRGDVMMLPQSLALEQATNNYEAARARYDALYDEPDDDLVANARARIKQAQANLDRLMDPVTESEVAEAEAMVRQAQAQLDLLQAGTRDEEIEAAAAGVAEAAAALQQAQASLVDTELRAPFAGSLAALHIKAGEQVVAGTPVAELAGLGTWQIETDDLTELDIVQVQEGDRVIVTFDAIEGLELRGTVERIKSIGQERLGDMTYTVVVHLDEQDPRLLWNMTAVVTLP
ncbi:MAG TPA: HlyD family efflux transporter periplasmic adaptor subunit [Anaerolineae bacterium]|nr:HlyD family efflux transporter periplasmic adaptor subunit [Anaerolineae bacterium]